MADKCYFLLLRAIWVIYGSVVEFVQVSLHPDPFVNRICNRSVCSVNSLDTSPPTAAYSILWAGPASSFHNVIAVLGLRLTSASHHTIFTHSSLFTLQTHCDTTDCERGTKQTYEDPIDGCCKEDTNRSIVGKEEACDGCR